MHKMMYKKEELYLTTRNSIFYFVRRVPRDLIQYYSSSRISFSLKTKSKLKALRVYSTVKQKLSDYWLGLRLQKLDIPPILIAEEKYGFFIMEYDFAVSLASRSLISMY